MGTRAALERILADLAGFADPVVEFEQYPTPADVAAHLVHRADLNGDLDRPVVDLGTGTGILAIAAATRGATPVVGLDRDPAAIDIARVNARRAGVTGTVGWLVGDAARPPICVDDVTVLMNPPFGAQRGATHADRRFLGTASQIAAVSYSIHNAGSRDFVEAFARDNDGEVTQAFRAEVSIDRQFDFHAADREAIEVEIYRITWA